MNLIIFFLYRHKLLYDLVSKFDLELEFQTHKVQSLNQLFLVYIKLKCWIVLLNQFSISLLCWVDYPKEVWGQNSNIYLPDSNISWTVLTSLLTAPPLLSTSPQSTENTRGTSGHGLSAVLKSNSVRQRATDQQFEKQVNQSLHLQRMVMRRKEEFDQTFPHIF